MASTTVPPPLPARVDDDGLARRASCAARRSCKGGDRTMCARAAARPTARARACISATSAMASLRSCRPRPVCAPFDDGGGWL